MLIHGSQIPGTPIMGLQTGAELAKVSREVINPHNLSIMAYEVEGPTLDFNPAHLRVADIREISDIGMIVDSSDEFVEIDDIIKLKDIYELHFQLVGKQVVDEKLKKIGKVTDYTIEIGSFVIQQINVHRPLLKSFKDAELLIHRSQIIEINDTTIVVKAGAEDVRPVMQAMSNYVNPFRQENAQSSSDAE